MLVNHVPAVVTAVCLLHLFVFVLRVRSFHVSRVCGLVRIVPVPHCISLIIASIFLLISAYKFTIFSLNHAFFALKKSKIVLKSVANFHP